MKTQAQWNVVINMPGYMPDADPYTMPSRDEARKAILADLERHFSDCADSADTDAAWELLSQEYATACAGINQCGQGYFQNYVYTISEGE